MDYLDEVRRAALPDQHDERDIWCGPELRWSIKEIETLRKQRDELLTTMTRIKHTFDTGALCIINRVYRELCIIDKKCTARALRNIKKTIDSVKGGAV